MGKSNEKKWSQIWTFLLKNGLKWPRQKKFITDFFYLFTPFNRLFPPHFPSLMSKLFRFSESLEKSNGKKWSQIWTFLFGSGLKLPYKTCWKPHFPMDERPLVEGCIANFLHISRRFWVFAFWMIFSVFQKNWVFGYSWSTLLWYRCYYPHRSRDALSPVCGIFSLNVYFFLLPKSVWFAHW